MYEEPAQRTGPRTVQKGTTTILGLQQTLNLTCVKIEKETQARNRKRTKSLPTQEQ